jgi:hypothetical protein
MTCIEIEDTLYTVLASVSVFPSIHIYGRLHRSIVALLLEVRLAYSSVGGRSQPTVHTVTLGLPVLLLLLSRELYREL